MNPPSFSTRELQEMYNPPEFYQNPQDYWLPPFPIAGNLYFVGDQDVGIHLIDTGEGLLLLDTGYPTMAAYLINAIWSLGFRPEEVRWIVHTHGHYDHFGATRILVSLSGARTYLSRVDAKALEKNEHYSLNFASFYSYSPIFRPDVLIEDGDVLTFGNTTLQAVLTPGHTLGCTSFFFTVCEGGRTLRVGLHGGLGVNAATREHQALFGNLNVYRDFLSGLDKVIDRPVDITLGNHSSQNRLVEKRRRMLEHPEEGNPFVDPGEWRRMLEGVRARLLAMQARDTKGENI